MTDALQHEYPRWETDPDTREDRFVWPGMPRFVSAKRARKLRKRGVPLMACHAVHDAEVEGRYGLERRPLTPGAPGKHNARYCWFETEANYSARRLVKLLRGRAKSLRTLPERIERLLHDVYGIERQPAAPYTVEIQEVTEAERSVRLSPIVHVTYMASIPDIEVELE